MPKLPLRPIVFLLLMALASWIYFEGGKDFLSLEYVQEKVAGLKDFGTQHPWYLFGGFFGLFVLMIALSIPGSIVLTLLAGALYGGVWGTIIVEFASTLGAVLAFLISRYLLKDFLAQKLGGPYHRIHHRFEREGPSYLFTLRLFPASPFVVINSVMGLTSLSLWKYTWITFIGMLPGNLIYVLAGRKLAELNYRREVFSAPIIVGLILISLLPYVWRAMGRHALLHSLGHNGRWKKP